jgi:hypothetical protein
VAQGQTTATLTNVLGTYYDKKFIEWEKQLLRMTQFAQQRPIPAHGGKTVQWTGYRPLPLVTAALTEATNPTTPGSFEARSITNTVAEWGYTVKMSKLLELTKLDPGIEEQVNLAADQAARTLDYNAMLEVCRNGIWGVVPTPAATSNTIVVTCVSSASHSTNRFVATPHYSKTGATTWVGAVATVLTDAYYTTGRLHKYGYAGRVSSWVSKGSSGQGGAGRDVWMLKTLAPNRACPVAFQSDDTIRIVSQSGLSATQVLSSSGVRLAQRDLVNNRAPSFGDGYYAAVISPDTGYDFKGSSTWVNAMSYSNIEELYRGEIGRWFGFRFVETTQPYRETTLGVAGFGSGAIYHNLFMGRNAFGHTKLEGESQKLIYINQGPDKTDPLDMYSIIGWKQVFANRQITAPHIVSVMTDAS